MTVAGAGESRDREVHVRTREELDARLAALPPVRASNVRVFRGQTKHYGSLVPSAYRQPRRGHELLFRMYVQAEASRLRELYGDRADDVTDFLVWTQAIAQQYGIGSTFLDVTKDVGVALWFALHEARVSKSLHAFGLPGPLDPATDYVMEYPIISFEEQPSGRGFVYVLDLPMWEKGIAGHGELVDLAMAPQAFTNLRMRAQHGCLVGSDESDEGGDLMRFVVDLLEVEPTISESWRSLKSSALFPSVSADAWLRHFVSIPVVFKPDQEMNLRLTLPLPIDLHMTTPEAVKEVYDRLILLSSPLFAARLRQAIQEKASWLVPVGEFPTDGISVLVEEPAFLASPEIGSGLWNEAVLMDGLPTSVPVDGPLATEGEVVDLTSVFLEFSVLEYGFWPEIESSSKTYEVSRGIFIKRCDSTFLVWFLSQVVPSGPDHCAGYLEIFFDHADKCFKLQTDDDLSREALVSIPWYHKKFLVALSVLRELSIAPIARAFPIWVGNGVRYIAETQSGGQLLKAIDPRTGTVVYVLKTSPESHKSYAVTVDGAWPDLDVSAIAPPP